MPDEGLAVLQRLAKGKRVLEIGTWKGRTAIAMAEVAEFVVTIDHFQGDAYTGSAFTLPEFIQNVRQRPELTDSLLSIVGDFRRVLPLLDVRQFNFLFYDGDHDKLPTEEFLAFAMPLVEFGAIAVIDDYSARYPQVIEAVSESLVRFPFKLRTFGALAVLSKEPLTF
jgi:predicted O-methyltransferase YrrM